MLFVLTGAMQSQGGECCFTILLKEIEITTGLVVLLFPSFDIEMETVCHVLQF